MAKNEAKIKFTAETGDLNKAIGKANNTLSEMRAELKLNETQMKANGESVEGLERQQQLLGQQMAAAHDKTEALSQKLNKAVDIFGENSDEASRLRRQLANAATEEERISQVAAQVADKLNEQRAASQRTASATELLSAEIDQQQNELNGLKQKYVDVVLQYGQNSNAATELAGEIQDLSAELNANKSKMAQAANGADALENSLDDAGDEAQDAGNQAEGSSDGWTILKDVISDMASSAIQWAVESFQELMTAADDALATLAARTGSASEQTAQFNEVMRQVYRNNYGEDYDDIADAMSRVTQILGDMDNVSLQNITENCITLRDTFDMDYQESLRAVNSLMDQFGITADQAFNLIAQGAQNGLNQNDDLLDTINEYSVQFEQAGFSAEEMFNMLNNGAEAGTWSVDKLGDAIKEMNIRAKDGTIGEALEAYQDRLRLAEKDVDRLKKSITKGGEEGKAAYGEILTALSSVTDESKRYQMGVEMFGTMWEDLGEEAVYALMNTQGELSATKNAMEQVKKVKFDTLSNAWSALGRILKTDLIQPLADAFAPVAKAAIEWLINHMDVLAPIIGTVAAALGGLAGALAIAGLIKGVSSAFAVLNAVLMANPITLIVAAIAGLVAAFIYLWNSCEGFRNFWIGLWEGIKSACSTAWDAIKGAFSAFGDFIKGNWQGLLMLIANPFVGAFKLLYDNCESFRNFMNTLWQGIKNVISTTLTTIKTAVSTAWNGIKSATTTAFTAVKTSASNVWNGIKTAVTNVVNGIKTGVSNGWNAVKTATSTAFNAAKSTATSVWNGIKTNISTATSGAKTAVSTAWNNVKSSTSTAFNAVKSTASSVWEGIKTSITGAIEKARDGVKNAIDKIKSFFNFSWSLPPIKLPHFSISGSFSLNPPSIPTISVSWYKDGGIMTAPTIFGAMGGKLLGGGEAGPEAILPIDKMEDYVASAVDKHMSVVNLEVLADKIEDLASRPINLSINGRQFALATAGDGDRVNGLRSTFKTRGLVLE